MSYDLLKNHLIQKLDDMGYEVFMYGTEDGEVDCPERFEGKKRNEIFWSPPPGISQKWVFSTPSPSQKDQEDERGKINKFAGLLPGQGIKGKERDAIIKARVNQGVFRDRLLEVYCDKCCMTGIDDKRLLVASHIKPWSVSSDKEKLKVENGLLLNALHDHAFDRGLITISSEGEVEVSSEVSGSVRKILEGMLLDEVNLPEQVKENPEFRDFLDWHRKCVFRK